MESFCIATGEPKELVTPIHNRMPVIVREQDCASWLNPTTDAEVLQQVLRPYSAADMEYYPVSKLVNNARNESASCMQRLV